MGFFNRRGRALLLTAALGAVVLHGCGDDNGAGNAPPTYLVTVLSDGTGSDGGGRRYEGGKTVYIRAGTPPAGYEFDTWTTTSGGVKFDDAKSSTTWFIMPANDVTVKAGFLQPGQTGHVHDWGDWVVTTPATCDAAGVETRTCKLDGSHKDTRAIAKLTGASCNPDHVHDWGDWVVTVSATCEAAGVEIRTCNLDENHKETQAIPKLTGAACNPGGGGSSETVTLGGLKWMTKNLNVETADSWCYGNSPDSCAKYGRLYTWSAAKAACQSVGMRLPTRKEWDALSDLAAMGQKSVNSISGGDTIYYWPGAGSALKSTNGWYNNGNGTDTYGFSALPGGRRDSDGSFYGAGNAGLWWSATEYSGGYAYTRDMYYYGDFVGEYYGDKSFGFSARCVQD